MITLDIGSTLTTDEEGRFWFDKLGMMDGEKGKRTVNGWFSLRAVRKME